MDPRREAGLDEIVSNFDENSSAVVENKYQIYNCEINQCNGSVVVVTEEHITLENGLNSEIPADLDNCMRLESPQTLVKLNFKKQMYFSSEDLNAIEDFEPTAI